MPFRRFLQYSSSQLFQIVALVCSSIPWSVRSNEDAHITLSSSVTATFHQSSVLAVQQCVQFINILLTYQVPKHSSGRSTTKRTCFNFLALTKTDELLLQFLDVFNLALSITSFKRDTLYSSFKLPGPLQQPKGFNCRTSLLREKAFNQ